MKIKKQTLLLMISFFTVIGGLSNGICQPLTEKDKKNFQILSAYFKKDENFSVRNQLYWVDKIIGAKDFAFLNNQYEKIPIIHYLNIKKDINKINVNLIFNFASKDISLMSYKNFNISNVKVSMVSAPAAQEVDVPADDFQSTDAQNPSDWETVTDNQIPEKAYRPSELKDEPVIYIARAYNNGTQIGKWIKGNSKANIPYGISELSLAPFEIYTGSGEWKKVQNKAIPDNAIIGGQDSDGEPLYIIRALIQGSGMHFGKAARNKPGSIPYKGKAIVVNNYEVLVKKN